MEKDDFYMNENCLRIRGLLQIFLGGIPRNNCTVAIKTNM